MISPVTRCVTGFILKLDHYDPRVPSLPGIFASCYLTEERVSGHQRLLAINTDKRTDGKSCNTANIH